MTWKSFLTHFRRILFPANRSGRKRSLERSERSRRKVLDFEPLEKRASMEDPYGMGGPLLAGIGAGLGVYAANLAWASARADYALGAADAGLPSMPMSVQGPQELTASNGIGIVIGSNETSWLPAETANEALADAGLGRLLLPDPTFDPLPGESGMGAPSSEGSGNAFSLETQPPGEGGGGGGGGGPDPAAYDHSSGGAGMVSPAGLEGTEGQSFSSSPYSGVTAPNDISANPGLLLQPGLNRGHPHLGDPRGGHSGSVTPALDPTGTTGATSSPVAPTLASEFARSGLYFEQNTGQTNAQAQFLARGGGYTAFLTADGPVLELARPADQAANADGTTTFDVVHLHFLGGDQTVQPIGQNELFSRSNYFTQSLAVGNVPNYAQVRYPNFYADTDLVYQSSSSNQLEANFVVAPGGSVAAITMQVEGAQNVSIDASGDLDITTPGGTLTATPPEVFQTIDGVQQNIASGYVLEAPNQVGFQVSAYDTTQALTIDPVLTFSTYLGGSGTDVANGIAVDAGSNSYIVGNTTSSDFPVTTGTYSGNQDAFVVRLDPNGNRIYSTYLGGSQAENGQAIAVDSANNAYVTGWTTSSDFPTTTGAYQTTFHAGVDAFTTE